jgi:hypothetical protein
MPALNWIPEKYPPAGGMAAEGFIALLGEPNLSLVELLVRETTQNSWDARERRSRVEMEYRYCVLEEGSRELRNLKENIFGSRPTARHFPALNKTLAKDRIPLLIVRDVNSKGLGGVTRADRASNGEHSNRYRKFLLNVGEQKHPEFGGGSYGYGRSICFRVSSCRTAVVYSRTGDDLARPESRLVVVSYGPEFDRSGESFNGRHWWTTASSEGQPITGQRADHIAQSIGIRPYAEEERGTTVAVVDPEFDDMSSTDVCQSIALSIRYHLWPKYAKIDDKRPAMGFKVFDGTEEIPLGRPETDPVLKNYVSALTLIRRTTSGGPVDALPLGMNIHKVLTRTNAADSPSSTLGHLVEFTYPKVLQPPVVVDNTEPDEVPVLTDLRRKMNSLNHHVAIMRSPELVVTYIEVPARTSDDIAVGGVFRSTDDDSNRRLRKSEPPAHDDWNVGCNDREAKAAARRVKRVIHDTFAIRPTAGPIAGHGGNNKGAVVIGGIIGDLLWSERGNAPGGSPVGSGGKGRGNGSGKTGSRRVTPISIGVPSMRSAQGGILTAEWEISFGKSVGARETFSIEVKLMTGDGDRTENIEPTMDFPRLHTVQRMNGENTKVTPIDSITHNLSPDPAGETVRIGVRFERGTAPTIEVTKVN